MEKNKDFELYALSLKERLEKKELSEFDVVFLSCVGATIAQHLVTYIFNVLLKK